MILFIEHDHSATCTYLFLLLSVDFVAPVHSHHQVVCHPYSFLHHVGLHARVLHGPALHVHVVRRHGDLCLSDS